MLGQVDICVTHTKKLLGGGKGFGVMAIEQSNGKGPYFATAGMFAPGSRQKLTFCYKESTNEPSFIVADKVQGGYLHNKKVKYPTTRNVKLSLLTGSHSSDTVEALKGGQLHSLQIRPFEPDFNAKYPAFTNVPFSKIKMCVGSAVKNCVEHKFNRDYANAKALFSAGYIKDKTVDQKGILKVFGPAKDSYQSCPMQRPGFNIQCNDGNKARWGYCTNCQSQPCQNADSNDADASIGIGLAGQSTPRQMGAGWTNYFASGKGTCNANSMTEKRVWFYVYENLML
jgi:hypothetical protein